MMNLLFNYVLDYQYETETKCYYCNKPGSEIKRFSTQFNIHKNCENSVIPIEQRVVEVILRTFPTKEESRNEAHQRVIASVHKACGKSKSLYELHRSYDDGPMRLLYEILAFREIKSKL